MKLDISRLVNVKRQSDGSIQCQCPACAEEGADKSGKNHLRVYPTGAFNCILHSGDKQHNKTIRAHLRGTSLEENPDIVYIDPEPTIKVDKVYPEDTLVRLLPEYTYWINRGAKTDVIKRLEGGLAPLDEKSKLAGRFIFPIRGRDGRITGFTGRLVEENSFAPTWKHLFKSSLAVWPWHVNGPDIINSKSVILVESVGDLLALMSHGINNVICLFGLNINSRIISTLVSANVKQIVISLNRDEDPNKGQRAAEKIREKLFVFFSEPTVSIKLPPEGVKDWGEATPEQIANFKVELS